MAIFPLPFSDRPSIFCRIAYILGSGLECPDPLYATSLDPSFQQKYPQVSWKIYDGFRDRNLTGGAVKQF
jgi:hypothetical protein